MRYWLVKSEPDVYPLSQLKEDGVTPWDGIRNYQARNFMRDEMKVGDLVLFYHSNTKPPGVVGLCKVASEPYPDALQFEEGHKYFDPKATEEKPRWILVDMGYVETFEHPISLADLKSDPALEGMLVTRKGQRLSVQPVEQHHFDHIVALGRGTSR